MTVAVLMLVGGVLLMSFAVSVLCGKVIRRGLEGRREPVRSYSPGLEGMEFSGIDDSPHYRTPETPAKPAAQGFGSASRSVVFGNPSTTSNQSMGVPLVTAAGSCPLWSGYYPSLDKSTAFFTSSSCSEK
jgi:hypothetical protein